MIDVNRVNLNIIIVEKNHVNISINSDGTVNINNIIVEKYHVNKLIITEFKYYTLTY